MILNGRTLAFILNLVVANNGWWIVNTIESSKLYPLIGMATIFSTVLLVLYTAWIIYTNW